MRLEFFFDYGSPFAYLGSTQLSRLIQESEAEIVYRPILLGGLFKLIGAPMVPIDTFSEPKRSHAAKDMIRWAKHWNVPFSFPSRFPMRTVDAMRLTEVVLEQEPGRVERLMHAIFKAYWVEDRDISDETVLKSCLRQVEINEDCYELIREPRIKQALIDDTQNAAERGVFGVPSFVVGSHLFWGQDRLLFVERALRAELAAKVA